MHYSDDDVYSHGSLSKRYVWGRIRQVQSDSDTRRNTPNHQHQRSQSHDQKSLLPKRQRQQLRPRPMPPGGRQLISGNIAHQGSRELNSGPMKPRVVLGLKSTYLAISAFFVEE